MRTKLFGLVVGLIMLTVGAFSAVPQTQQGSKCMYYGFSGLSNLSVDDSYLGGTYFFADRLGVWAEIGFNFQTDKPVKTGDEFKTSKLGFDIGLTYYLFQKGPIGIAIGPEFGFFSTSKDTINTDTKIKTSEFFAGIGIAAEWWVCDNISLSVTSFIGFDSYKTTKEYKSESTEATDSKIGILGSQNGKVYINFYF